MHGNFVVANGWLPGAGSSGRLPSDPLAPEAARSSTRTFEGKEKAMIARRLRWYLEQSGMPYEVLPHPHSRTSLDTAREARVQPEKVVKPVLLEDERGYVMAVVPASCRLDLRTLRSQMHRDLELASEAEIEALFADCERGAMPALGGPYHIPTVYEDSLSGLRDVYFEAGDHEELVHMRASDFLCLLEGSLHGHFSHRSH
jgi:Ala-tRNA(Pro) deacylase